MMISHRLAWVIEGLALAASLFWAQNLAIGSERNLEAQGRSPASLTADPGLRNAVSVATVSSAWYHEAHIDFAEVKGGPRDFTLSNARIQLMVLGQHDETPTVPFERPTLGVSPVITGK